MAENNYDAAIKNLVDAERNYELAYEKSFGFYPRINQLTLRFLRASLLAGDDVAGANQSELLAAIRLDADKMFADTDLWKQRLPDDAIWIQATRGELHFLIRQWERIGNRLPWSDGFIGWAEILLRLHGHTGKNVVVCL